MAWDGKEQNGKEREATGICVRRRDDVEQEGTEWNMSGLDDMEQDGSGCDRNG